jgi:hypothetical protein
MDPVTAAAAWSAARELLRGSSDAPWHDRLARRRAWLLADVFLGILDLEAEAAGSPTRNAGRHRNLQQLDAVYEGGVAGLPGPLGVEIKVWESDRPLSYVRDLIERYGHIAAEQELAGVLLVLNVSLSAGQMAKLTARAPESVTVWGRADMEALVARRADDLPSVFEKARLEPVRAALADDSDWRPVADTRLTELRTAYQTDGLVLVLGAGVSVGSGIPNWDDLVGALFVSMVTHQLSGAVTEDQAVYVSKAAQALGGDSPLLSARYLRTGIESGSQGDANAFQQALSNALYRRLDGKSEASELLSELAQLCRPLRSGAKVEEIITYNFDDQLERELAQAGVAHCTVISGRERPSPEDLPIYHVHGFLPRDTASYEGLDAGILAFSEEGYHQLFRDPYHWTNVVQLQAFQQRRCVFIGLSLTDPNLRRLLEYAANANDEPRHFVFQRRLSVEDLREQGPRDDNGDALVRPDAAEAFLRVHHGLQERVLGELGLQVVWFEQFDAMPAAVRGLRPGGARAARGG